MSLEAALALLFFVTTIVFAALWGSSQASPNYTSEVNRKLNADKTWRYWPGNTIVAHIDWTNNPEWFEALINFHVEASETPLIRDGTALTPVTSYHTTTLDLFNDGVRERYPERWKAAGFNEATTLAQVERAVIDRALANPIGQPEFRMRFAHLWCEPNKHLSVRVEPVDQASREAVDAFRKATANVFSAHFDPEYKFHVTVSYPFIKVSETNEKIAEAFGTLRDKWTSVFEELPPLRLVPQLTFFYNMSRFEETPVFAENEGLWPPL